MLLSKKNNKGADQTARMRRLVCAFVVRKPPKTSFLAAGPNVKELFWHSVRSPNIPTAYCKHDTSQMGLLVARKSDFLYFACEEQRYRSNCAEDPRSLISALLSAYSPYNKYVYVMHKRHANNSMLISSIVK